MNIEEKYIKYGLAGVFALQIVAILFGVYESGTLISLVVAAALGVAAAERFGFVKAKIELCDAHIYKNKEDGSLLYCDSKQASHASHDYLGTSKVNCKNVGRCSLS
jgi:uncharacterized membrane protein YuzA (DUF378 family)